MLGRGFSFLFVLERVRTAINQLGSEYLVPELGGNTEALLEVCKVVLEVVFLKFLVVRWESAPSALASRVFVRGLVGKLTIYDAGNSG